MNGGLLNGDLREDLKVINWEGRQVFVVLDKDPESKQDTLSDASREKYKLGAILDHYGADVFIGTIPGAPEQKIGMDDHLLTKTFGDVNWKTITDFVKTDPYLKPYYKQHNLKRHEFKQKNKATDEPYGNDMVNQSLKPRRKGRKR